MKTNNELISVIVPIYNVEKYLHRCIDSILQQTYQNLEIILVDDGSPDNCGGICDEYAQKDSRIKVLHKTNGGLSDARNAGRDVATGEWLVFVDSDDCVSKYFVERLYDCALKSQCSMVQCRYKRFSTEIILDSAAIDEGYIIRTAEEILENIDDATNTAAWNKLYHYQLLQNISFPKGKIHEDVATTYKLFDKAKNICIIEDQLYYYFINQNSITKSKIKTNKLDLIDAYWGQIEYFKRRPNSERFLKDAANRLVALFGTLIAYPKNSYENYSDFYAKMEERYQLLRQELLKLPLRKDLKCLVQLSRKKIWKFKLYHKIKNIIKGKAQK